MRITRSRFVLATVSVLALALAGCEAHASLESGPVSRPGAPIEVQDDFEEVRLKDGTVCVLTPRSGITCDFSERRNR